MPPFFSKTITHVFIKKAHPTDDVSVLVTGQSGSTAYESVLSVTLVPDRLHLRKFYAFHSIKDLQDRIPLASPEQARQLKNTIMSISQATGILSDFTAMFTVLEGAELHFQPSLGQDAFQEMQPFTQGQCRGQERFRVINQFARGHASSMCVQQDRTGISYDSLPYEMTVSVREGAGPPSAFRCRILFAAVIAAIIILIVVMVLLGVFVF
jgi:hypothetical protein